MESSASPVFRSFPIDDLACAKWFCVLTRDVEAGSGKKPGMWKKAGSEKNRDVTKDVEAGSGKTPGMWKRSFFCGSGSGSAKILPLPLPHRLFELSSNLAKKFCPFPNVD